jgi:hypothetical protein
MSSTSPLSPKHWANRHWFEGDDSGGGLGSAMAASREVLGAVPRGREEGRAKLLGRESEPCLLPSKKREESR